MPLVFTNANGKYIYKTNGPSSVPTTQIRNNGQTTARMGMPMKPNTMSQGSVLSNARQAYIKDAGGGKNWYGSSSYTQLKRINAIGRSSTKQGLPDDAPLNFSSQAKSNWSNTTKNSHLRRARSGGCVAPKKKGAIANTFKSGGGSAITGTGTSTIANGPATNYQSTML
jgi:hypothetical protein